MLKSSITRCARYLVVPACLLAVLLMAAPAFAEGRVHWGNTHPKERGGQSWKLEIAIYLRKAPDLPHIPVNFEFTPTASYERDLVDGDKIVERRVPLRNQQAIIESVDVGFLDPGTGSIQKRTKFVFSVTRAHDFRAGEYRVKIRDARNGHIIGRPVKLVLEGKNKTVDRRTMVFTGEKKAKKKEEMKYVDKNGNVSNRPGGAGSDKSGDSASSNSDSTGGGDSAAASGSADTSEAAATDDNTEPSGNNGADNAPPPIKQKPGCNCHLEATHAPADPALLLGSLGLLAGLVIRRRRRSRRAA